MNAILPTADNSRRVLAIDGYRAIAITIVMLHHAVFSAGAPEWLQSAARLLPECVFAFWVLSGFLITRSILREEERSGAIQFRFFYSRQAVRFFVPLIAYLIPVAIFVAYRAPGFDWWWLFRPAILDPNTFCIAQGVSHLYSLVLQIYFWLIWPMVLKISPLRLRLPIAFALSLLALLWRIWGEKFAAQSGTCPGRVDYFYAPILLGSLFALAQPRLRRIATESSRPGVLLAFIATILVLVFVPHPVAILSSIIPATRGIGASLPQHSLLLLADKFARPLVIYLAWAFLVFGLMNNVWPRASRLLSSPALTWLGRISFSVYLWQSLFCFSLTDTFLDRFPLNIFASIFFGYVAYRVIELPSLRWRSTIKKTAIATQIG